MEEKNHWKTIAIIFIVITIIESIFIFSVVFVAYKLDQKQNENQLKCQNTCSNIENVKTFYYNKEDKSCYCYDQNEKVVKQLIIQ